MNKIFIFGLLISFSSFTADRPMNSHKISDHNIYDPPNWIIELEEQKSDRRTFYNYQLKEISSIDLLENMVIGSVGRIDTYSDKIAIVDSYANTIKLFNDQLEYLGDYGEQGSGPGEFQSLIDIHVSNEYLHGLDSGGLKLIRFSLENNRTEELNLNTYPYRLSPLKDNNIVVVTPFSSDGFFTFVNWDGEGITFGTLIEDQEIQHMSLDGYLSGDINHKDFYYLGRYGGFLLSFDKSGSMNFAVKTIQPKGLPDLRISHTEDGSVHTSRPSDDALSHWGISISDSKIFVNSRVNIDNIISEIDTSDSYEIDDHDRVSVIDIYDRGTGEYMESILIEYIINRFSAQNNKIVAHASLNNKVIAWQFNL